MAEQLNTSQTTNLQTLEPIQGLRIVNRNDELYSSEYFGGLAQLAGAAAKSHLFGELTVDQLFIVLMTGREMGLPPTVALRNIGSFKGKTVISSQLQMGKVKEAGYVVKIVENTDERATVSVGRKGEDPYVKTFTMADAVKAELLGRNALYKTNPSTMLLNRAIGLACRYGAPEVLNGLYNESELIELDEPRTATLGTVQTVAGEVVAPAPAQWGNEALSEFEVILDRGYQAYKAGGFPQAFDKFSTQWKALRVGDPEPVLNAMDKAVAKLESAAEAKAKLACPAPIEVEIVTEPAA